MTTIGKAKLRVEIREVTPQMAAHLRLTCHYERQRAIADLNVKRLASEMAQGNFIPGTTIYFAVLPDRSMWIMNGNHTLEAVVWSGVPQTLVFIYLEVKNVEEAHHLYGTFDIHKTRTWIDALKAMGADKEIAMPTKTMPAVGLIQQGFQPSAANVDALHSRNSRWDAMDYYKDAAAIFKACLEGCPYSNRNAITRSGVMSVALYTLRYQRAKGVEFWEGCAQDDGLTKGDPRKSLLQTLLTTKLVGGKAAPTWARLSMSAWNAWMRGDALYKVVPIEDMAILGTPFGSDAAKAKAAKHRRYRMDEVGAEETGADEAQPALDIGPTPDAAFSTGIETDGAGSRRVTYLRR
jgi:hypothetical protein